MIRHISQLEFEAGSREGKEETLAAAENAGFSRPASFDAESLGSLAAAEEALLVT
jgi:hypothetical protein